MDDSALPPPSPVDLDRIEAMIDDQDPDAVVVVHTIAPLVRGLVAEVRRLQRENTRLRERVRNLES
jgi:hypothetical protein